MGGPAFIVDGVELGGLLGIPGTRWPPILAAWPDLRAPTGAAGPAPSSPPSRQFVPSDPGDMSSLFVLAGSLALASGEPLLHKLSKFAVSSNCLLVSAHRVPAIGTWCNPGASPAWESEERVQLVQSSFHCCAAIPKLPYSGKVGQG